MLDNRHFFSASNHTSEIRLTQTIVSAEDVYATGELGSLRLRLCSRSLCHRLSVRFEKSASDVSSQSLIIRSMRSSLRVLLYLFRDLFNLSLRFSI